MERIFCNLSKEMNMLRGPSVTSHQTNNFGYEIRETNFTKLISMAIRHIMAIRFCTSAVCRKILKTQGIFRKLYEATAKYTRCPKKVSASDRQ